MPFLWIPFIALPLAELIVFLAVADAIGFFGALAACILAALLGVFLIQKQGMDAFMTAQEQMRAGKMPLKTMFNALCVTLAGFLFIIPGFVTDFLAILLLIPPIREHVRDFLSPRMDGPPPEGEAIEAEFERVDEPHDRLRGR